MNVEQFISDFSQELIEGTAAYFIGAGISKPSNLPNWNELISPSALKIGIEDLSNIDLPLLAQYVINEETGNRGPFINSISKKIRKKYSPNVYHESIVKTNIKTIWTTNYDNLLETAYGDHIVDMKVNDDSISRDMPDVQIEIIKMHGCIFNSHRDEIIITESDYEDFFIKRPATAQRLKIDLLQKSFLFIGYGYGDSNIKNIITEARRLSNNSTRRHYFLTVKKDSVEFSLWSKNLKRFGIQVIELEEHKQLEKILEKLSLKSRGNSVFITGSHANKRDSDVKKISEALARESDVILNDGQSTGVMRLAARSYMEKVIEQKDDINKRLRFFANPYAANPSFTNDPSLIPMLKQWRLSLFKATQIVIAFDGGMGTQAEIEKALELGCIIIPYFKNNKGILFKFLENDTLINRINEHDNSYISKAKENKLTANDVINLVKKVFGK